MPVVIVQVRMKECLRNNSGILSGLIVEGSVTSVVSDCPMGSIEVDPRFGTSCRYSLQCPSPYFCNQKGRCCQLAKTQ